MGQSIKGITVQIGGETTGLDKALSGVNKQSRSLQNELKTVERLLKLDPNNVILMEQKQELLAQSVSNTKEKLNKLEEAQEQVNQQFADGKIDEEQYRAFQREIVKTQSELAKAEKNLDSFGKESELAGSEVEQAGNNSEEASWKIAEAGDQAEESGEKAEKGKGGWKSFASGVKVAVAGLAAAGTVLASGLGYAVSVADDAKGALNDFEAATGLTGEWSAEFEQSMKNLYAANYGEGFEDISQSMATVAQSAREIDPSKIEDLTRNGIALRDTFGFDIQEQMRAVNMLMDQFGLSGDEAFNLIAQGAQLGLDKNGDFLDSINEYSVHYAQLGLDAEEMFNSFVNGAYAGTFSVDKLGDAVKEFGIRVKDGSADDAFKQLGLDAEATAQAFAEGGDSAKTAFQEVTQKLFEMQDPLEQNTIGTALFGTMWEDLGAEGVQALSEITGGIDGTRDALSEINKIKYDTFGDAVSGLGRILQTNFVLPIGEQALPIFSDFVNEISAGALNANGDFGLMAESFGTAISNLVTDLEEILPQITTFGTEIVSGLLPGILQSLPLLVSAAADLILQLANAIIAQLPLLVSAGMEIISQLLIGIANAAPQLLDGITEAIISITLTLIENIPMLIDAAIALVQGLADGLIEALPVLLEKAPVIITKLIDAIVENLPKLIEAAYMLIIQLAEGIIQNLPLLYKAAYQIIGALVAAIPKYLGNIIEVGKSVVSALWDAITGTNWLQLAGDIIDGIVGGLLTGLTGSESTWEDVKQWFVDGWNGICTFFTETIPTFFSQLWTNIKQAFSDGWNAIVTFFTEGIPAWIDSVIEWFNTLPERVGYAIGELLANIVNFGLNVWNWVTVDLPLIIQGIIDWFATLPSRVWEWLVTTINNIIAWGTETYNNATQAASDTIQAIIDWFAALPGKVWTWLNETINKIKSWGTDMVSKGKQAASELVTTVKDTIAELPGKVLGIGEDIVRGIWNGITNMKQWIKDKVSSFADGIVQGFKDTLGIHSPSTVFRDEIGQNLALGVGDGFIATMNDVSRQMQGALPTSFNTDVSVSTSKPNVPIEPQYGNSLASMPKTLVIKMVLEGKEIATAIAPFSDIVNGNRQILAERGLIGV